MKRLILGVAIASALGLTACGEDSYNELKDKTEPLIPESHLVFDPAKAEVPLPNDLLLNGTTDGTLNIPGEAPVTIPIRSWRWARWMAGQPRNR